MIELESYRVAIPAVEEIQTYQETDMRAIILSTALTLATGLAFAQSQQGGPSSDGYMVQGGKVMMTKGGKTSPMDSDTTLSDGTKIMTDGTVVRKDGTKSMMKDGDRMDMSGAMRK